MMGSKDPETAPANEEVVAMSPQKSDPSRGDLYLFPLLFLGVWSGGSDEGDGRQEGGARKNATKKRPGHGPSRHRRPTTGRGKDGWEAPQQARCRNPLTREKDPLSGLRATRTKI